MGLSKRVTLKVLHRVLSKKKAIFTVCLCTSFCYLMVFKASNLEYQPSSLNDQAFSPERFFSMKVKVDESPKLTNSDLLRSLAAQSNMPLSYYAEKLNRTFGLPSCAMFPLIFNLDFNNLHWQRLRTPNATFYLFRAYYDDRPNGYGEGTSTRFNPKVRILGMVDRVDPVPPTTCYMWYANNGEKNVFAYGPATYIRAWKDEPENDKAKMTLKPIVITCDVRGKVAGVRVPMSVSLVSNICDVPLTNLRVHNDRPLNGKKEDFAVCVGALNIPHSDVSARLIEWVESLILLNAKKVFVYDLDVHPNVSEALAHFQRLGTVEVVPFTLPGKHPNLPELRHFYLKDIRNEHILRNELRILPYNDCLYRSLHTYRYVLLLDIDEIVVPEKNRNFSELLGAVTEETWAMQGGNQVIVSHCVQRKSYSEVEQLDPRSKHPMGDVYNEVSEHESVRCFHDATKVLSLLDRLPGQCTGSCKAYSVPINLAKLELYKDCGNHSSWVCGPSNGSYSDESTVLWRHRNEVIMRTQSSLKSLGLRSI